MGGAAAGVDVDAVGLAEDQVGFALQPLEQVGSCAGGCAVGAVHDDAQALERPGGFGHMSHIFIAGGMGLGLHPADLFTGNRRGPGRIVDQGFHRRFQLIGQLTAVGAEDLDAVVLKRIVGRRNDNACIGLVRHGEIGHGRCGDDPQQYGVGSGGADARGQSTFQHIPGNAGVPADIDLGLVGKLLCQHTGGGKPGFKGQSAGQFLIGYPTDAVCSKIFTHFLSYPFLPVYSVSSCWPRNGIFK